MDVGARLIEILTKVSSKPVTVEQLRNANLNEALGLTSVDSLELLIRIEGDFDIEIDDEDLSMELLSSFNTLQNYVQGKMGDPAEAVST
jgi:acyl carrier protein